MTTPTLSNGSGMLLSVRDSLLAMAGLGFVTMMVAIDQTVVGTALPTVVAELRGFSLYAWVMTAYLLTSIITIPIFGRLGDLYGRKPFVVLSIALFTVASVLCGMAQSMIHLVFGRALQGIAGGMMLGTAFALVPDLFPDPRVRLRWQVILSSCFGIANAVGPTLGGFLTYYAGWRAVFFINLPLGLIGLFLVLRYIPHIRQVKQKGIHLDWQGTILIALALSALQFLVQLLPQQGASAFMVLLGVVVVGFASAFVWWEKRAADPLVPMAMFTSPGVAILCLLSLFVGFIMFGLLVYVPLLLQGGFGLSAREVGVMITPMVVFITVGSILSARILPRLQRPDRILHAGFGLLAVCGAGLLLLDAGTSRLVVALFLAGCGTGLGFLLPNLTIFIQEIVGRSLLGISTAVLQSSRMVGGMLGTAAIGSVVTHIYVGGVRELDVTPFGEGAWRARLEDPQVLVNSGIQSEFVGALHRLGLHGDLFILHARESMVTGIHAGFALLVVVAIVGLVWLWRLPAIRFRSPEEGASDTPSSQGDAVQHKEGAV